MLSLSNLMTVGFHFPDAGPLCAGVPQVAPGPFLSPHMPILGNSIYAHCFQLVNSTSSPTASCALVLCFRSKLATHPTATAQEAPHGPCRLPWRSSPCACSSHRGNGFSRSSSTQAIHLSLHHSPLQPRPTVTAPSAALSSPCTPSTLPRFSSSLSHTKMKTLCPNWLPVHLTMPTSSSF